MKIYVFIPFLISCTQLANFLGSSLSNSPVDSISDHQQRYQEKRDYQQYYKDKKYLDKKKEKDCVKNKSLDCDL